MATKLRELILSEENIYNAIYALESYISERDLLSKQDLSKFLQLRDKYDFSGCVGEVIRECKETLKNVLDDEKSLFEIEVYFKVKKLSNDVTPIVEYRPLHTSSLVRRFNWQVQN